MPRLTLILIPLAAAATAMAAVAGWYGDRATGGAPGVTPRADNTGFVYPVSGFTAIGLAIPATVEVRVGPAFSVRAEGPARAFDDIRVYRDGESLRIAPRPQRFVRVAERQRTLRFVVTMPRITGANVGGSGGITIDRVAGERFDGAVGGSGTLALRDVAVDRMTAAIGGSGAIIARGAAGTLDVNLGGSGRFAGDALHARNARVSSSGSGSVHALVDGDASVSLAGSGMVDLGRAARCTVSRVGSGSVTCGN